MTDHHTRLARRGSIIFLQTVIVLIGIGTLVFLLWEPQIEGRNVHATQFEIYFNDPFLAYAYTASIAFFVALYQAFTLLGYIGKNKTFSLDAVRAVRTLQYCGVTLVVFIAGAEAYLCIVQRGKDDIAGGVAMGLFAAFLSLLIAAAAAVCERILQSGIDIKAESD